jgi:hypothetical protein
VGRIRQWLYSHDKIWCRPTDDKQTNTAIPITGPSKPHRKQDLVSDVLESYSGEYGGDCLTAPCNLTEFNRRFRDACFRATALMMVAANIWNVGKFLPDYTVQQPRRESSSSLTWNWSFIRRSWTGQIRQPKICMVYIHFTVRLSLPSAKGDATTRPVNVTDAFRCRRNARTLNTTRRSTTGMWRLRNTFIQLGLQTSWPRTKRRRL